MLRQQLDALSRLAAAAWRIVDPAESPPGPVRGASVSTALLGLEKALRLQVRVAWAIRLIGALRAKLLADLQALDSGQMPTPPEARSFAADAEGHKADAARGFAERVERPERAERPERLQPERFGFERRTSDDDLAEILKRPTVEVIALICRELGLPEDWPSLAEAAWAREETDGALVLRQAQDEGLRLGPPFLSTAPPSAAPTLSSS